MRGRKPTPSKLKNLAGNPGHRPVNRHEPEPDHEIPDCPSHIVGAARKEWKRVSVALDSLGLVTAIDRAALAGYCVSYGRWVEAERHVQKLGVLCAPPRLQESVHTLFGELPAKEVSPAQLIWNPWLAVANKAMEQMLKFLTEFGMTPSSRSRVHGEQKPKTDADEQFLFGAGGETGETRPLQ